MSGFGKTSALKAATHDRKKDVVASIFDAAADNTGRYILTLVSVLVENGHIFKNRNAARNPVST